MYTCLERGQHSSGWDYYDNILCIMQMFHYALYPTNSLVWIQMILILKCAKKNNEWVLSHTLLGIVYIRVTPQEETGIEQ